MHDQESDNPYLTRVPLDRVRSDALYGVRLARLAWRQRDSEGAARELGKTIEPGHEHELVRLPRTAPAKPARRKARKSKKTTKRRRGPKTTRRTKT